MVAFSSLFGRKKQGGGYVCMSMGILSAVINLSINANFTAIIPIIGIVVLFFILQIKRYWDAMELKA